MHSIVNMTWLVMIYYEKDKLIVAEHDCLSCSTGTFTNAFQEEGNKFVVNYDRGGQKLHQNRHIDMGFMPLTGLVCGTVAKH